MLIHQDSMRDSSGDGPLSGTHGAFSAINEQAQALSEDEKARLWERIVRIHFLAADLMEPGLAPHVTDELTRFVTGALREWAVQAEDGLMGSNRR